MIQHDALPTTKALRVWPQLQSEKRSWQEAIAGLHIGRESRVHTIRARVAPVPHDRYGFAERERRFFDAHIGADEERGRRALDVVERHTPPAPRERVLQAIWEGTDKRWGYFDGVYVKYVLADNLGSQPPCALQPR